MKAIFIGMGGGYDILAAYMLSQKYGYIDADIGGMLNPKFIHYFDGGDGVYREERAINYVNGAKRYKRNIYGGYDLPERHFVDNDISKSIHNNVIDLSILKSDIRTIVHFLKSSYDKVIFCDVGGDVLFFGEKDFMVKTPIIDAYSLKIADELCKVKKKLADVVVIGLGLDGELPYKNINTNINILNEKAGIININQLDNNDIKYLNNMYNQVKVDEEGKTINLLIDIGNNSFQNNYLIQKRNILDLKCWFGKVFVYEAGVLASLNPLTRVETYESMISLACNYGINLERYKLNGET